MDVSAAGIAAAVAVDPVDRLEIRPVPQAPVPSSAQELVGIRQALALMAGAEDEAEAVDRIRALEQLKAACAAAQVRETNALDTLRRSAEETRGVPVEKRGRGLAGEIGLARGVSPHQGSRLLKLSRALATDLPQTLGALTEGAIGEDKATAVHRETAWLPHPSDRSVVDATVADRFRVLGAKQLAREARHLAIGQDRQAALEHFDRAVTERRVTLRPTENGMATLTATIPLVQAAACHRALGRAAAGAVTLGEAQDRTPAQLMADILVERLTGQASPAATPVEVHLVMTDTALLGAEDTPARIPGHGSIPAPVARRLLANTRTGPGIGDGSGNGSGSGTGTDVAPGSGAGACPEAEAGAEAEVFLRRLYTAPETGQLVAMDSRRRTFPALLRRMVILRDDLCRTPFCDAQVKHLDHATPHGEGGATSWANASGLCARCNYTKEDPGWTHTATPEHLTVTTPTGHRYHHPAPPLVGREMSPPAAPQGTPLTAPPTPPTAPPDRARRIPGITPLRLSRRQLTALRDTGLLRAA